MEATMEKNLDVFCCEDFRKSALRYGLEASEEVISICGRIVKGSKEGIVKIRNVPAPLFRTRFRNKFRIFFILGKGQILFTALERRNDNTYKPSRLMRRVSKQGFLDFHSYLGAGSDLEEKDESSSIETDSWDDREIEMELSPYLELQDVKAYAVTPEFLTQREALAEFLKNDYLYHASLKEKQRTTVEELALPGEARVWSIHGPAGSGKTTCAIHLAQKMRLYDSFDSAVLFVVPNDRLAVWVEENIKKHQTNCFLVKDETISLDNLRKEYKNNNTRVFVVSLPRLLCLIAEKSPRNFNPLKIQSNFFRKLTTAAVKDFRMQHWAGCRVEQIYDLINYFRLPGASMNPKIPLLADNAELLDRLLTDKTLMKHYDEAKEGLLDDFSLWSAAKNKLSENPRPIGFPFHLLVDESQDYTSFLIRWLFDLFLSETQNANQKIVFLSDMNQRIRINDFLPGLINDLAANYGLKYKNRELEMHFRSTREIAKVAYTIMENTFQEKLTINHSKWLPVPVGPSEMNTNGDRPILLVAEKKRIVNALKSSITEDPFNKAKRLIFIREKERTPDKELESVIENSLGMILDLYTSECKGLEFDNIVLLHLFPNPDEPLVSEIHRLYTSVTRAKTSLLLTMEPLDFERYKASESYPLDSDSLNIIENCSEEEMVNLFERFKQNEISLTTLLQMVGSHLDQYEIYGDKVYELRVFNTISELIRRNAPINTICDYAFRFFSLITSHRNAEYLESVVGGFKRDSKYWSTMLAEYKGDIDTAYREWGTIGNPANETRRQFLIRTKGKANSLKRYRFLLEFGDSSLIHQDDQLWERTVPGFEFLRNTLWKHPSIGNLHLLSLYLERRFPEAEMALRKLNDEISEYSDGMAGGSL